jgi:hypothetical protein
MGYLRRCVEVKFIFRPRKWPVYYDPPSEMILRFGVHAPNAPNYQFSKSRTSCGAHAPAGDAVAGRCQFARHGRISQAGESLPRRWARVAALVFKGAPRATTQRSAAAPVSLAEDAIAVTRGWFPVSRGSHQSTRLRVVVKRQIFFLALPRSCALPSKGWSRDRSRMRCHPASRRESQLSLSWGLRGRHRLRPATREGAQSTHDRQRVKSSRTFFVRASNAGRASHVEREVSRRHFIGP